MPLPTSSVEAVGSEQSRHHTSSTMSSKRTEPDPRAESTSHPNKKPKTNSLASRAGDHLSDCTDLTCTGCAAGEIELTFLAEDGTTTTQPPPTRLLSMALEEASAELYSQHAVGMAKQLFDLAIEGFEHLKEEAAVDAWAVETRCAYGTCLVEFGRYLPVQESAKEGVEVFQGVVDDFAKKARGERGRGKSASEVEAIMSEQSSELDEAVELARALVGLGKAKLVVVQLQRKAAQEQEPEDEDEEEGRVRLKITKEEKKLYNEALEAVEKGLAILNSRNAECGASAFVRESILVAKELHSYGTLLDQPHHRVYLGLRTASATFIFKDHALEIFSRAIAQLAAAHVADPKSLDNDNFVQRLWGACLYNRARSMAEGEGEQNTNEAKTLLQQAIDRLSAARKLADSTSVSSELLATAPATESTIELELLGQSYILLSTLAEDEEEALNAFDTGVEQLKHALELDPDNEDLREQLALL
ncbi:hypothetical protein BC936DRAFT_145209 [Jimgerdemannia flammicorona]|uniref:Uncharacterized protein n=1 Tax=Jimgerdemannia flammicorona TaxID=994334 RepID=A0A433DAM3_9FUNG|nr:hypothetical protein BC936DRAFT_145209 [Jimgerdemannia flammicorona]